MYRQRETSAAGPVRGCRQALRRCHSAFATRKFREPEKVSGLSDGQIALVEQEFRLLEDTHGDDISILLSPLATQSA